YVGGISRLPLKVVVTHSGWIHTDGGAGAIAIDIVRDCRQAKRLVGADRLVTRCTIGNPQLQHVDKADVVEEILIRYEARHTHRRNGCDRVVRGKYVAAVAMGGRCDNIALCKAVV